LTTGRCIGNTRILSKQDTKIIMDDADPSYYSMDFIEEDGKTYVLFHDQEGNLVAKHEIPHQDITEAIRLSGEDN
jgi:hypothetical protein